MKHGGLLQTSLKNYVIQHTGTPKKWFAANLFRGWLQTCLIGLLQTS